MGRDGQAISLSALHPKEKLQSIAFLNSMKLISSKWTNLYYNPGTISYVNNFLIVNSFLMMIKRESTKIYFLPRNTWIPFTVRHSFNSQK